MRCYAQLTQDERYQIRGLLKAGYNVSEIADETGRHRSTISREVRRNSGQKGYRPSQAQRFAAEWREAAVSRRISDKDWEHVARLIRFALSPERASPRLFQEQGLRISIE